MVLLAAAAALSACAQAPETIQPAYVSPVTFSSWTCEQLGAEQARLSAALATASAQQSQARSNDIAGVILIGLPVSSMSGENIAPQIARYKGEQEAVRLAAIGRSCPAAVVSTVAPPPPEPAHPAPPVMTPTGTPAVSLDADPGRRGPPRL